jgi:hypothetical protein
MKELNPDIVVCDFFSCAGAMAARELGIPVVINVPYPLGFCELRMGMDVVNMN